MKRGRENRMKRERENRMNGIRQVFLFPKIICVVATVVALYLETNYFFLTLGETQVEWVLGTRSDPIRGLVWTAYFDPLLLDLLSTGNQTNIKIGYFLNLFTLAPIPDEYLLCYGRP